MTTRQFWHFHNKTHQLTFAMYTVVTPNMCVGVCYLFLNILMKNKYNIQPQLTIVSFFSKVWGMKGMLSL